MARDHSEQDLAWQPRAKGEAAVTARAKDGATRVAGLRQQGSAKVLIPRTHGPALEAVLLNTAGGVTGGDRFHYRGTAEANARLTLTTQTAERAYKAQPGQVGEVSAELSAEDGAHLSWLPQETILFDGSAIKRRLEVDLAPTARLLAAETLIFGRAAMGERLKGLTFTDNWRIRRGGALIFAEAFRLTDIAPLSRPAALDGAGAAATILFAGAQAEGFLAPVRRRLPRRAGASAFDDKLVIRILEEDGFAMRRALIPIVTLLNGGPPPKVWMI